MTETTGNKLAKPCDESAGGDIPQLTNQFYITLRARFARVDPTSLADPHAKVQYDVVVQLFEQPQSWGNAYEIEQRLVHIVSDDTLATEAGRRAIEVARNLPHLAEHYRAQLENADVSGRRATTARMVDDLQWHYEQAELKNRFRSKAAANAGFILMAAVGVFLLVFFSSSLLGYSELLIAIVAGMLGAAFSWIVKLRDRLQRSGFNELKLLRYTKYAMPRLSIGIGGATILFFLLQAGALSGSLFPRFTARPEPATVNAAMSALIRTEIHRAGTETDAGKEQRTAQEIEAAAKQAAAAQAAATAAVEKHLSSIMTLLALGDSGEAALKRAVNALVEDLPKVQAPDAFAAQLHAVIAHEREVSPLRLDSSSLALLILWSVLAGFSERLVPTLLQNKADQATGASRKEGSQDEAPANDVRPQPRQNQSGSAAEPASKPPQGPDADGTAAGEGGPDPKADKPD